MTTRYQVFTELVKITHH